MLVSTSGGWQLLDAATWTQGQGDHNHYYTADPVLHDLVVPAETRGHVVVNDGLTALFDDGTGQVTVFAADGWTEVAAHGAAQAVRSLTTTAQQIHVVDYAGGKVWRTFDLPQIPNEIVGVTG